MKRALDSTSTTNFPTMALNNATPAHRADAGANAHQAAPAPAPPAIFNPAPASVGDRLLAQPVPGDAPELTQTAPGAVPAATLPTWSNAIHVQAGVPALTMAQRAERGDANAQYDLGCIALGAKPAAFAEARMWLEKAAAQQHGDAECRLGMMHAAGDGVPASEARAFEWFARSASHGSALGQMQLGEAYLNGAGIEKDNVKAYDWFSKAAAQGEHASKTFLGYMHYKGLGTKQDFRKALELICATNYEEGSINIDWQLGYEYLKKAYPKDINVLLPHLFSIAKLNMEAKQVSVEGPELNDQGSLAIAATLGDNSSVRFLQFLDCKVGGVGANALKKAVYSTVTPLQEIDLGKQTGFEDKEIAAMNRRLAQNPQIIELEEKYIQPEIRFESRIGLPPEIAQMIIHDLILIDQTRLVPDANGGQYASRKETGARVEEVVYTVAIGNHVLSHQV